MIVNILIKDFKCPSINGLRYKGTYAIKKEHKISSDRIQQALRCSLEFQKLKSIFNKQTEVLEIGIIQEGPHLNRAGTPSSRSVDISNYEKMIVDELTLPSREQSLQIDDKYVWFLHSRKVISETYNLRIEIRNHKLK